MLSACLKFPKRSSIIDTAVFGSSFQAPYFLTMTDITAIAQQLGKRGGQQTRKKYGTAYYSQLGKRGMAKRWGKTPCSVCGRVVFTAQLAEHLKTEHLTPGA
jgi:hypothetical protein